MFPSFFFQRVFLVIPSVVFVQRGVRRPDYANNRLRSELYYKEIRWKEGRRRKVRPQPVRSVHREEAEDVGGARELNEPDGIFFVEREPEERLDVEEEILMGRSVLVSLISLAIF